MSVPKYHQIMRPLLEMAAEGESSVKETLPRIATYFDLSDADVQERIPSGKQGLLFNRLNWAKTYLKKAGLLEYPDKGRFRITERGEEFLKSHSGPINSKILSRFDSFVDFKSHKSDAMAPVSIGEGIDEAESEDTPEERIASAIDSINAELANELLERIQDNSPAFFERLLVQLLVGMGYGGTAEEAGRDLGGSGDGGVDGVIDQDVLGVDQIYIQAKRYADTNSVGPGAVRDFFGALNIKRAHKGIFFTTSYFTQDAVKTARDLGSRIVLIDGKQLARLMIRYEIGCRTDTIYTLRKVDEDFFDDG